MDKVKNQKITKQVERLGFYWHETPTLFDTSL